MGRGSNVRSAAGHATAHIGWVGGRGWSRWRFLDDMRPQSATTPEGMIASLASRQQGVVSLTRLIAAGISARAVSRRVRANRLHRIHRGVFAVGHTGLSKEGRWLAAALACGPTAVLNTQT